MDFRALALFINYYISTEFTQNFSNISETNLHSLLNPYILEDLSYLLVWRLSYFKIKLVSIAELIL